MQTNLTFTASGYLDGLYAVLDGFQSTLQDWQSVVIEPLVGILGLVVAVVGIWYGTRAIIRAMRAPK